MIDFEIITEEQAQFTVNSMLGADMRLMPEPDGSAYASIPTLAGMLGIDQQTVLALLERAGVFSQHGITVGSRTRRQLSELGERYGRKSSPRSHIQWKIPEVLRLLEEWMDK